MSEQGEQTDLFDAKIFWGDDNAIDFSMCNPPFYSDAEEIAELAEFKQLDPHAVRRHRHPLSVSFHFIFALID